MSDVIYDAAIVGAGPIGIELACAMKREGKNYIHFDAKQIGYTISWYAPQTRFFSSNERIAIAGVPLYTPEQGKATREQYLAYLRTVVENFDLAINTYEPVLDVQKIGDVFDIITHPSTGRRAYKAKNVILSTGGTDRPRLLNIPGENLPHVSHYFDDPHQYFRKKVLVVGGRNSAVEAALRCHHAGARVTISYRRDKFVEQSIKYWLMPELRSLINAGRMPTYFRSKPVAINNETVRLQLDDGKEFDVTADFVLLLIGYEQDSTLFKKAGVHLNGTTQSPTFNAETMQTNVPGLYVAGTAVGGTQERFTVFIENCHEHTTKIMKSIFGVQVRENNIGAQVALEAPES